MRFDHRQFTSLVQDTLNLVSLEFVNWSIFETFIQGFTKMLFNSCKFCRVLSQPQSFEKAELSWEEGFWCSKGGNGSDQNCVLPSLIFPNNVLWSTSCAARFALELCLQMLRLFLNPQCWISDECQIDWVLSSREPMKQRNQPMVTLKCNVHWTTFPLATGYPTRPAREQQENSWGEVYKLSYSSLLLLEAQQRGFSYGLLLLHLKIYKKESMWCKLPCCKLDQGQFSETYY